MHAQFEEKTYEQWLTSELVHGRRFFAPGQVLENIVGFDVALRTKKGVFWRLFAHIHARSPRLLHLEPTGSCLSHKWWTELERELETFPKFKFNCFIQVKRPHRMIRRNSSEYSTWNRAYFRYETSSNQQRALEYLAGKVSGKAAVVYACPAFHKNDELWRAYEQCNLIEQSNFCDVEKLCGHVRYSFVSAGNLGYAHSEPTVVESAPFDKTLEALQNQEHRGSNLSFLLETAQLLEEASEQLGTGLRLYKKVAGTIFRDAGSGVADALGKIFAFEFVSKIRLLIGYGERELGAT